MPDQLQQESCGYFFFLRKKRLFDFFLGISVTGHVCVNSNSIQFWGLPISRRKRYNWGRQLDIRGTSGGDEKYCEDGKTTEIQGITDHKIVSGLHTIPCRPLVNFSPNFLGFLLNSPSYHDQLKPLIQGIKVSSISKKALGETRVCFAKDLDEQAQIGGFFNGLEMLITLHQRKLESLKN